ncbi:hypothetical protein OEZ86_000403 [Tetradesmus obliquus]|uniref:Uncharacterized protein n=1 Tax=Tetradesmus obliquus TaxID=3088 RepID=A0ABY8TMB3_TETOB|nr:hypothetical protein OEZ85_010454 [Tetradesmus obliquus]WIA30315.1 hypothetical protein OEZ86_000403 [Tetradesmus obliquus]
MMTTVASRVLGRLTHNAAAGWQVQASRTVFNAGNKDSEEPAASPWVKVLRRPGDADANRSEAAPVVREGETPMSTDVSFDVPEKNPDKFEQQPLDPALVAKSEANTSQDSVRFMADKLNQAVGGGADFPKTGGASLREMASEIGDSISESVGGKSGPHGSDSGATTPEQQAATRAVEQAKSK